MPQAADRSGVDGGTAERLLQADLAGKGGEAVAIDFPVLGRPLRARRIPAALRRWLEEHWHRPEHAPDAHPFAITLEGVGADEGDRGAALEGERVRATMPGFDQTWHHEGTVWEWRSDGAGVRLELEPEAARIQVWGNAAGSAEALAALHVALCEALRASGLVPLHAAVAVPPGEDGRATALLGRSGVGKSTTLLRLVGAGWRPLAEDLSWIDPETLALYAWDRGVRLWPGTLEAFLPQLAAKDWRTGADGKLFLAYDELGPVHPRTGTLERFALLARVPDGGTGWEPLAPAEAVRALWEAVGVPLAPTSRTEAAAWIASAIKRVPAYRLKVGATELPAEVG